MKGYTVYYEIRYEITDAASEEEAVEKADARFNQVISDCQDVANLPDYTDHTDTLEFE